MSADLFDWLSRATVAVTAATALVLLVRPLWRRVFGPAGVLWPWLLVPALVVAVSVPRPARVIEAAAVDRSPPTRLESAVTPSTVASDASRSPIATGPSEVAALRDRLRPQAVALVAAWLGGAVVLALGLARRQRRFMRALGPLRPRGDGSFACSAIGVGPVLVGVLRPRIVVPADFELRFDPSQRALVLEHERVHLRRGDLQTNLLAAGLRCLFWFDPLVHLAAARLRVDQELACDAAVLRRHPSAGRAYATALLNSQLAAPGLPVGCGWQSGHPLKWRITMLRQPVTGFARLLAGAGLALGASSVAAVTAWASQPQAVVVAVAPAVVAVPEVDPAPAPAIVPATPQPVATPTPVVAPAPGVASAPVIEPSPAVEPSPTVERAPAVEPSPAVEPAPTVEPAPVTVPASRGEPAPLAEPTIAPTIAPAPAPVPLPEATSAMSPSAAGPDALVPPRVARLHLADAPRRARDRDYDAEKDARMIVSVEVDAEGRPHRARVVETNLGRAYRINAVRAVKQWTFEPARQDGRAVAATVLVPVMFDLDERAVEHAGFAGFRHPRPMGPPVTQPAAPRAAPSR